MEKIKPATGFGVETGRDVSEGAVYTVGVGGVFAYAVGVGMG